MGISKVKHQLPEHLGVPRFISEAGLAEIAGLSSRTLQKWRLFGHGPAYYRIRGAVRYRLDEVLDYINRGKVPGRPAA